MAARISSHFPSVMIDNIIGNDVISNEIFSFLKPRESEQFSRICKAAQNFLRNKPIYFNIDDFSKGRKEELVDYLIYNSSHCRTINLFGSKFSTAEYSVEFITRAVSWVKGPKKKPVGPTKPDSSKHPFVHLKKLKLCFSSEMKIKDITHSLFPSLESLVVCNPTLTACSTLLGNLPDLKRFTIIDCTEDFDDTRLTEFTASIASVSSRQNPASIHILYNRVAGKKISSISNIAPHVTSYKMEERPAAVFQDLSALQSCTTLKKLQITENFRMGEAISTDATEFLKSFTNLRTLRLQNIRSFDVYSKLSPLTHLKKLSLRLHATVGGRIKGSKILEMFPSSLSVLSLDLQNINAPNSNGDASLIEGLTKLPIHTLIINCSNYAGSLFPLFSALGESSTLRHIELHNVFSIAYDIERQFNNLKNTIEELFKKEKEMFERIPEEQRKQKRILIVDPNLDIPEHPLNLSSWIERTLPDYYAKSSSSSSAHSSSKKKISFKTSPSIPSRVTLTALTQRYALEQPRVNFAAWSHRKFV